MNSELLCPIEKIFGSYLGDKKYIIPAYQRGYKWEAKDVTRLLDDIAVFEPNEELDLFYCLQNITLVEAKDNVDGNQPIKGYNVVDGQQRLTTLIVILSFLQEYQIIKDKIEYNVRPQTEDFICNYLYKESNLGEFSDWNSFLKYCDENGKDYDYQDIFYLFQSYKTVSQWFKDHPDRETMMKDKILDNVKMIVNLTKNVEEQDLFENLNGKRVPLDGADLIRAIIITRVAKQEVVEFEGTIKANVILNERRIRIGMALDEMNRWWSQSEVSTYFRYFAKEAKVEAGSTVAFNDDIYPINHLFKLYVLAFGNGNLSMDTFEKESVEDGFFDKLVDFHRTLQDWYGDQKLYHLILFAYLNGAISDNGKKQSLSFKKIYGIWKEKSKLNFINWLKERIQENAEIKDLVSEKDETKNESRAFEENYFDAKYICIYVLLDIIDILKSPKRINRLPARNFKAADEDLEHIFPQTPIGDRKKELEKQKEILKQYVETINRFIEEGERIQISEIENKWNNEDWRKTTKELINEKLKKVIPINSLGNICLLHRNVNRGYGNDFFLDKRIDVMRKSQDGLYVRPHVYDAFNKVFLEREQKSIGVDKMTGWNKSDILERRKDIIKKIFEFLNNDLI